MNLSQVKLSSVKFLTLLFTFSFLISLPPVSIRAQETKPNEAYEAFAAARGATHSAGPFRLQGEETSTKERTVNNRTVSETKKYSLSGYDYSASETLLQFTSFTREMRPDEEFSASFLITPSKIYLKGGKPSSKWEGQDIIALLPKFTVLGTLDQFFMLEILNGDRLSMYADYMSAAPDVKSGTVIYKAVQIKLSRAEFAKLAETLTQDVRSLLGAAAEGMSDMQIKMVQSFAKGIFESLDAEMTFTALIDPETGRISRINTKMDMADPYGPPASDARIKTSSSVRFYDFGKEISRTVVS